MYLDLRFDMRREREHWAAGGSEEAATSYLPTMFLFVRFVPDGLMIRDIDR